MSVAAMPSVARSASGGCVEIVHRLGSPGVVFVRPSVALRSALGVIAEPSAARTLLVTTIAYFVLGRSGHPSAGPTASVSASQ